MAEQGEQSLGGYLYGATSLALDAKSRLAIPTRYHTRLHEECEGELVITVDWRDRCLLIYPLPEWEQVQKRLMDLPSFSSQARLVQRLMMGHATDAKLDSHGRVLITPALREHAQIDKSVMLLGQGNKFEVWDSKLWQQQRDDWVGNSHGVEQLAPEVANLKI